MRYNIRDSKGRFCKRPELKNTPESMKQAMLKAQVPVELQEQTDHLYSLMQEHLALKNERLRRDLEDDQDAWFDAMMYANEEPYTKGEIIAAVVAAVIALIGCIAWFFWPNAV